MIREGRPNIYVPQSDPDLGLSDVTTDREYAKRKKGEVKS